MVIGSFTSMTMLVKNSFLDQLRMLYVSTARAKGLTRRQALWRHVLRNAMIPVLTVAGLQFANLITGTIVVENVFVLPGIGRLVFQAISNRDLIVVRDVVMLLAAVVVVVNFVVDVFYAVIDVARHQVGAAHVDFFLAVVVEVVNAAVLQEPADDADDADVFADVRQARAQTANAAHQQIDFDAGL